MLKGLIYDISWPDHNNFPGLFLPSFIWGLPKFTWENGFIFKTKFLVIRLKHSKPDSFRIEVV